MPETIQQLLSSFDALSAADKHQVAVEILRRVPLSAEGDLPRDALAGATDELFRALDTEEEGSHAQP